MCSGVEYRLLDCPRSSLGTCSHSSDAGVVCQPGKEIIMEITISILINDLCDCCAGCRDGDIRLVGGINSYEGRVEICLENEYGTVCDQMWDVTDAAVVCRQFGLPYTGKQQVLIII